MKDTTTIGIIGQFVDLKKHGDLYLGLCPFHKENTPSFAVYPKKHHYHCFGCGVSGKSIQFLMEFKEVSEDETTDMVEEKKYVNDKVAYVSDTLKKKIKEKITKTSYETWFESLALVKLTNNKAHFAAKEDIQKDWVEHQYSNLIKNILTELLDEELEIVIE
jgi:DNA primase